MMSNERHEGRAAGPADDDQAIDDLGQSAETVTFRGITSLFHSRQRETSDDTSPVAIFGDYELLEEVGKGGMGVVFKARQLSADRIVALKLIRPEQLENQDVAEGQPWLDRFLTEARATARLQHNNVVTIYDVGEVKGIPYYSMRYVDGKSLAQLVRNGPIENHRAATLMECVARAIAHAHEEGVLHRDLKPQNILVSDTTSSAGDSSPTKSSQDSTVKGYEQPFVADFGLAKWIEQGASGATQTGEVMGTPSFMSPEQAQDASRCTEASDVYSLGATLYDILTARPPFRAASPVETLRQVIDEDPVAPRHLNSAIAPDLETITLKCLAKDPSRRYGAAVELAEDLANFLAGRPITARPVSTAERAWRWARRHRAASSAILATVLGLIITGVLSVVLAQQARTLSTLVTELQGKNHALEESNRAESIAKEKAENRLTQIENGNDILGSIFFDLDPDAELKGAPPLRIRLASALDRASESIEGSAIGDPAVVAKMQATLGSSQIGLGNHRKAITLLEKAYATLAAEVGEQSPDALHALNRLAVAHIRGGKPRIAIAMLERSQAGYRALGLNEKWLETTSDLGWAYGELGQFDESIRIQSQALKGMETTLPKNHIDILRTKVSLIANYLSLEKTDLAIKECKAILPLIQEELSEDHQLAMSALELLALAYSAADDHSTAIDMLKQSNDRIRQKYGDDHYRSILSLNSLAAAYWEAEQFDEAIELFSNAVELGKSRYGASYHVVCFVKANLASNYIDSRRDVKKAIELLREVTSHNHPLMSFAWQRLVDVQAKIGNTQGANKTLQEMKKEVGTEDPETRKAIHNLGMAYITRMYRGRRISAKEKQVALALVDELVELNATAFGSDSVETLEATRLQLQAYAGAGDFRTAEQILSRLEELPEDNEFRLEATSQLGVAYYNKRKFDKSIPIFEKLVELQEGVFGEKDGRVLFSRANLGMNYYKAGDHSSAIEQLERAYADKTHGFPRQLIRETLTVMYEGTPQQSKIIPLVNDYVSESSADRKSTEFASILHTAGGLFADIDAWEDAERVLRECVKICEGLPASWATGSAKSDFGLALLRQNKLAEAERYLVDGYKEMNTHKRSTQPVTALERIVEFYSLSKDSVKLKKWQAELDSLKKKAGK